MPLITSGDVIVSFGVSLTKSKIEPPRFDRYVTTALAKLKTLLPEAIWADINKTPPADGDRKKSLEAAAIELSMFFALPNLHTYLTENGVILSSQSEGSTVLRYLTPKEINDKQQTHLRTATEIIGCYVDLNDIDGDGFVDSVFEYTESRPVQFIW
ncbi:MAG TPA: hypothetical protein VNI84_08665 [Pyrinomonadaceae bacterium]|nr:hypothetical protein [Pyrinomonadaceae bacterium]